MTEEQKRKFENLTHEEAEQLSKRMGDEIRKMVDQVVIRANKKLNKIGLTTKMQIVIEELKNN